MSAYPALRVTGLDLDTLLTIVDDFSPTAVEEHDSAAVVFFTTSNDRDRARLAVLDAQPGANLEALEVDDEDWARRSQENLTPITVGRLTIHPRAFDDASKISSPEFPILSPEFPIPNSKFQIESVLHLIVPPSMGFGTGHHATTRLCLAALQLEDLAGAYVLDIGTGSGVLAMAARLLGARSAVGIDNDPDAVHAANETLAVNPQITAVRFECADLRTWLADPALEHADLVTANLTGALLCRTADMLVDAVRPGGRLIVSGIMRAEHGEVAAAFSRRTRLARVSSEDEWVGLQLERN